MRYCLLSTLRTLRKWFFQKSCGYDSRQQIKSLLRFQFRHRCGAPRVASGLGHNEVDTLPILTEPENNRRIALRLLLK